MFQAFFEAAGKISLAAFAVAFEVDGDILKPKLLEERNHHLAQVNQAGQFGRSHLNAHCWTCIATRTTLKLRARK